MKTFLLFLSFAIASTSFSQDSIIVKLNDKVLYNGPVNEDTTKNKITLAENELTEGKLTINYKTKENAAGWERTIFLTDLKDRVLFEKKGNAIGVNNLILKQLFKKMEQINVYTWSLPKDEKLKATVRVRRILLCTLQMK